MGENSPIEWTHHTFNPWWGCTKVSPACDHCYAERWARRVHPALQLWDAGSYRLTFDGDNRKQHWRNPFRWNKRAAKAGVRERVFCASMADVFDNHRAVADARVMLWETIRATPHLDWLLLTKRIGNAKAMLPGDWGTGWPNVWLGISVCNQEEAERDTPKLLALPARVRFLSCEPLLGPISFEGRWIEHPNPAWHENWLERIDWIIAGGESGPKARPMHPDWARSLRDQCTAVNVPFFFKQWGEWAAERVPPVHDSHRWPITPDEPAGGVWSYRVGKKAAGRLLDGRTWDEIPA